VNEGGPDDANQRREQRIVVRLDAELVQYGSRLQVFIADISAHGAMVRGKVLPEKGEEVLLRQGRIEVVATIAWSGHEACGLSFHRPLDAQTLKMMGRRKKG
jgi:hypothetical protein